MSRHFDKTEAAKRDAIAVIYLAVIFGFDRISIWIDRPGLPNLLKIIKKHCADAKVYIEEMFRQPRWKLRLEIFQPTTKCLDVLAKEFGCDISVLLNYVEIAFDLPATSQRQALLRRNSFLASAKVPYQRDPVVLDEHDTTLYYGRRTDGENRSPHVLAVYADCPSKILNARPTQGAIPCTHTEYRGSGSPALEKHGIASLSDLIQFEHQAFWEENIRLYQLPKQITDLGRLLAKACGDNPDVSGSALRKRASRWVEKHSIDDGVSKVFVMHNALLATPNLERMLHKISFSEWIKYALSL